MNGDVLFLLVGFNLSYVINSSGTYDKSAGKGSVTVSAY